MAAIMLEWVSDDSEKRVMRQPAVGLQISLNA
jgi:hypothetical protein